MQRHLYTRFSLLVALSLITVFLAMAVPAVPAQEGLPDRPFPGISEELDHYAGDPIPPMGAAEAPLQVETVPWSKLVFQSYRDGNWSIYGAEGNGSNQVRLTQSGLAEIHPRLNMGATRIAYTYNAGGDYEIQVMNLDGSQQTALTANDFDDVNPDWSPDGSQIVFESYRDGQPEIYVMNADGSAATRLTADADYDGMPVWSPDGSKIAFVSRRTGGYRLYTMNMSSGVVTPISTQPYSLYPAWSPNGTQIAYSADLDGDSFLELWQVNADGSSPQQVFDPGYQVDAWARSWSADGRYIGFTNIGFIFFQGNWYWTDAFLDGWDTSSGAHIRVSNSTFDWNPAWKSTDSQKPTSGMTALPAQSPGNFTVNWAGVDPGSSGLLNYDVQVKDGANGSWSNWLPATTVTSGQYPGIGGHSYYFRVRARDHAANLEAWPATHDAMTTVEALPPNSAIQALPAYSYFDSTITWGSNDPGGSAIAAYDVQYKQGAGGSWVNWQMNTMATSAEFQGTPGQTYYFRIRARDSAQNQEAWPAGNGDASTTLYRWQVSGTAYDNTGTPLAGLTATTNPAELASLPSKLDGEYTTYVAANSNNYDVSWHKNGYSQLPTTTFPTGINRPFSIFLPPANNLTQNWGFESGNIQPAWEIGGDVVPTLTSMYQHTGQYAVILGQKPANQFGSQFHIPNEGNVADRYEAVADTQGHIYATWVVMGQPESQIYYGERDLHGNWSYRILGNGDNNSQPQIDLDSLNNPHVVWSSYSNIYYTSRNSAGNWVNPLEIETGSMPQLLIDESDRIHVAWHYTGLGGYSDMYYRSRPLNGSWSQTQNITSSHDNDHFADLVADIEGTVYLLWESSPNAHFYGISAVKRLPDNSWSHPESLFYVPNTHSGLIDVAIGANRDLILVLWSDNSIHARELANGFWLEPELIASGNMNNSVGNIAIGADGAVHVVYSDDQGRGYYVSKRANSVWSEAEQFATGTSGHVLDLQIAINATNQVHIVWTEHFGNSGQLYHLYQTEEGGWSATENLTPNLVYIYNPLLLPDESGAIHLMWLGNTPWPSVSNVYYAGPPLSDNDHSTLISQAITLTSDIPSPILSFFYHLSGVYVDGESELTIFIEDETSITPILRLQQSITTNTHHWIDLAAWAGQPITLTIQLSQAMNEPYIWVYLDEITLGSTYPDLWIEGGEATAPPGEQVVYTLLYGNRGGADATNTTITHPLPAELTFVSASVTPVSTSPLVWEVGDLAAKGGPFSIVVTATVSPSAEPMSDLALAASIGTESAELETANNTAAFVVHLFRSLFLPIITR